MTDDELLQQFDQSRCSSAFDELVRRHLDWVYSAALRRTKDAHLAEDVTQATFLVLAQKAGSIRERVLAAWLFQVARAIVCPGDPRRSPATEVRTRRCRVSKPTDAAAIAFSTSNQR